METCTKDRIMNELDEIIEHIFSHLPMKELHNCARVCKRWSGISRRTKRTRHELYWLMNHGGRTDEVEQDLRARIQIMSSEPKFALVFCSSKMYEGRLAIPSAPRSTRLPRAAKMECVNMTDYLHNLLPPQCPTAWAVTDGVVGTAAVSTLPMEHENISALSCLLLPDIEALTITHFFMTPDKETSLQPLMVMAEDMVPDMVSSILGIPQGKQPKLVLLFETETKPAIVPIMDLDYMLLKTYKNIVVAGGYVDNIFPEAPTGVHEPGGEINTMGVAFTGDDIKVASVILSQRVTDKSGIEQRLKKLKDCHIPSVNQVGFMFSCLGRGEYFYDKKNMESSVFHAMFPNVPLFGFFGNGEIGYDYLPDYSKPEELSNFTVLVEYPDDETGVVVDMPEINHSYTTIFVLVSLGNN